ALAALLLLFVTGLSIDDWRNVVPVERASRARRRVTPRRNGVIAAFAALGGVFARLMASAEEAGERLRREPSLDAEIEREAERESEPRPLVEKMARRRAAPVDLPQRGAKREP